MKRVVKKCNLFSVFLLLISSVIVLCILFPAIEANAQNNYQSVTFDYVIIDGNAEITGVKKDPENTVITVPEKIGDAVVTGIGEKAFYDMYSTVGNSITQVILPETIEYISENAFARCFDLKEINFPDGLKTIGASAFFSNYDLRKAILPDSVTYIGDSAFEHCFSLWEVRLPENMENLGNYLFHGSGLKTIELPKNLKSIGNYTFDSCDNLKEINLPETVTSFGDGAFINCNFTSFNIPSSVKSIGKQCFKNCSYLEKIILPQGIRTISEGAFDTCGELKEIVLPSSVTRIEESAFAGCWNLTELPITENVEHIGRYAYFGCKKIKNITLPSSVSEIGDRAFENTGYYDNDINWEKGFLYIGNALIVMPSSFDGSGIKEGTVIIADGAGKDLNNMWRKLTIPYGIKYIGESAFSGMRTKAEISIPATVEKISYNSFNFVGLLRFDVAPENKYYSSDNSGVLFNKDKTELIRFPVGSSLSAYSVPVSVKVIGKRAFEYGYNLCRIALSAGLKEIQSSAFTGCSSITQLKLPEGLEIIGSGAFVSSGLKEITIPASVKEAGNNIFMSACSLEKVVILNPNLEFTDLISWDVPATIHSYENSGAKEYAEKNNIKFVSMGTAPVIRVKQTDNIRLSNDNFVLALPATKLLELSSNFGAAVEIKDQNGNPVNNDADMKSGMTITLRDENGKVLDTKTIVVPGDNDGDGVISASDARAALRASVKLDRLNEWQKAASNLDNVKEDVISAADARYILRASVKLEDIAAFFEKL